MRNILEDKLVSACGSLIDASKATGMTLPRLCEVITGEEITVQEQEMIDTTLYAVNKYPILK